MATGDDNPDGENSLAICLERGLGIAKDMEQSVWYYRRAGLQRDPPGMNNFARSLKYGLEIEPDLPRAAKCYRLSAELTNANGNNNFRICLECGVGIQANIDLAAESDKRAADRGHPEGALNYRRCPCLLCRWTIPDRSSAVSDQKPDSEEHPTATENCTAASLRRFARTKQSVESIDNWRFGGELGKGHLEVVMLAEDPKRKGKRAVKTLHNQSKSRSRVFGNELS
jgi:TPR repeat protein